MSAYTDPRRETFANIMAKRHPAQTMREANLRVWLRVDPETAKPEVTRRVTNLAEFVIVKVSDHFDVDYRTKRWHKTGLKVYTVENVETGVKHELPAMGNGTTVWTVKP